MMVASLSTDGEGGGVVVGGRRSQLGDVHEERFLMKPSRAAAMRSSTVMIVLFAAAAAALIGSPVAVQAHDWPSHGGAGLTNRRVAYHEKKINATSVRSFSVKWEFITGADVTAAPAVVGGKVYFPSWNGNLYAVHAETGKLIWEQNLTELTAGVPEIAGKNVFTQGAGLNMLSRSTPTVVGSLLIVGLYSPGAVIAVKRSTGALVWTSVLDKHPLAVITQCGTAYEGAYYIGTSSLEEAAVGPCCTFQGAFFKLNRATGAILWKRLMLPDNGGKQGLYAGVSIWGSSPPIDTARRLVYVTTGNAYSTPPNVSACRAAHQRNKTQNPHHPTLSNPCIADDDYVESVVAIEIDTGAVAWAQRLGGDDTWTFVCVTSTPPGKNCPPSPGKDYDFGEEPMLMTIKAKGPKEKPEKRDVVVVGQKSGFIWALDRYSGEVVWVTAAGPGGLLGGSSWGMTTDGERVFTNIINDLAHNFTLLPSGTDVVTRGGWVAMDASNGNILWSTANPDNFTTNPPLTYANGVVFGGSVGVIGSQPGKLVALDAKTGEVLWTHITPGPLQGGFSVVDGVGYVGVGVNVAFAILTGNGPAKHYGQSTLAFSTK